MRMEMRFEQQLSCTICGESMTDHKKDCPQGIIQDVVARRVHYKCTTKCHKWSVEANRDDFLECRLCKTVYSAGAACGYDADKLPRAVLFSQNDEYVHVVVLPEPGNGDFPIDGIIERLLKQIKEARARASKRRKPE